MSSIAEVEKVMVPIGVEKCLTMLNLDDGSPPDGVVSGEVCSHSGGLTLQRFGE
jgi:hypothetical protein